MLCKFSHLEGFIVLRFVLVMATLTISGRGDLTSLEVGYLKYYSMCSSLIAILRCSRYIGMCVPLRILSASEELT